MELSGLLMIQMIKLFLMIFMGYVIVKIGLLKSEDSKVLSIIVLYLVVPCVILNAFQVENTPEMMRELGLALVASIFLQVVLLQVVNRLTKILKLNEVEMTSVYYSNSGNLIVPLVAYMLGEEWVSYACVFMGVQSVFLWTHCRKALSRQRKIEWKKVFLNSNIISILISVVLYFSGIRFPEMISGTLSAVGSMIGPLSMVVIGMTMAGMDLKKVLMRKSGYKITVLRLLVIPVCALVLLKISGMAEWSVDGKQILLIVYLAVISPSAATVTQMSQVYGNDAGYASVINVLSTLLAIVTMPLMVMMYQSVM